MKETTLKSALVAVAVFCGGIMAMPAFAGQCDLCALAEKCELEAIQSILDKRPEVYDGTDAQSIDINGQRNNGKSALLFAAKNDCTEVAALLLGDEHDPANPNLANKNGRTPLMWAAQNGNFAIFGDLLKYDADVHIVGSKYNQNALYFALQGGNEVIGGELILRGLTLAELPNISEYLHSEGIANSPPGSFNRDLAVGIFNNRNAEFEIGGENTPLIYAAKNDNADLFDALDKDGADPTVTDDEDRTISEIVAEIGNPDIVAIVENDPKYPPLPCPQNEERVDGECVCVAEYVKNENGECVDCAATKQQLHPDTMDSCVPTVEICKELGAKRNAEYECEQCSENQVPAEDGLSCICDADNGFVQDLVTGTCVSAFEIAKQQCEAEGGLYAGEEYPCHFRDNDEQEHGYLAPIVFELQALGGESEYDEYLGWTEGYVNHGGNLNFRGTVPNAVAWASYYLHNDVFNLFKYIIANGAPVDGVSGADEYSMFNIITGIYYGWQINSNSPNDYQRNDLLNYVLNEYPQADVNFKANNFTALHLVIYYADEYPDTIASVITLLDAGVDCNIANDYGYTAWNQAEDNGHNEILALMERSPAEGGCLFPRVQAASAENCETTYSLELGADPSEAVETVECEEDEYIPYTSDDRPRSSLKDLPKLQ